MIITKAHVQFWIAKRAGIPSWVPDDSMPGVPDINVLINSQQYRSPLRRPSCEPANTLAVLKKARVRGAFLEVLGLMATHSHSLEASRRIAYCRRWVKRINEDQAEA